MPDNSFAERFRRLEPIDLLTILNTSNDYQPEAVDAARKELESRQLSEEELANTQKQYEQRIKVSQVSNEKWQQIKTKVESAASELSPVQFGPQSQDKYIRSVVIFAGVYFLFMLYRSSWLFSLYSVEDAPYIDWSVIDAVLPLTWLPIGGILFGLKRKIGWLLMFAYFWKVVFGSIAFMLFFWQSVATGQGLLVAVIFAAACYALMRKDVRETFKADNMVLGSAIALGSFVALFPLIMFYFETI
jgi:hypothetical protein